MAGNKTNINRLTNANIYYNGNSLLGMSKEINCPAIEYAMADHEALGMAGKVEFFSGIEKMESSIMWNSYYPDVLPTIGDPTVNHNVQVRSSLESWNSAGRSQQLPVVLTLTLNAKNFPGAGFKQHENVELESKFSVTYMKLEIDRKLMCEVDVLANILRFGDKDVLATYRKNLGI